MKGSASREAGVTLLGNTWAKCGGWGNTCLCVCRARGVCEPCPGPCAGTGRTPTPGGPRGLVPRPALLTSGCESLAWCPVLSARPAPARGTENVPPAGDLSIVSVAGRRRVVPPCTPPSMPTALTCPPGHSASPTLLSGTTPRARWLFLGTGGPRAGPHRDGLHSLSVCRPARTRCALGPGPRPRRNSHCPQPPGPAWRAGGEGRLPLPPPAVGAAGRGAPGRPGGEQGRSPVHRKPLGTSAGMTGPRGLGSDSPCPLPVPAGETQGPGTSLALHFPAGTSPLPAGRPLPRGALPPASLSSQASLGACWACRGRVPVGHSL